MSITPKSVYEKLVALGFHRGCMIGCPDRRNLEAIIRDGGVVPDHLKPGGLLATLTPEEREALKGLTSDMVLNYRL